MNLELAVLRAFFNHEDYAKYSKYLSSKFIENNHKELWKLYQTVSLFHKTHPNTNISSGEELEIMYYVNYPGSTEKEKALVAAICSKLHPLNDSGVVSELLVQLSQRAKAAELSLLAINVADGKEEYGSLIEKSSKLSDIQSIEDDVEDEFSTDNLEQIYDTHYKEGGLRWRLQAMNMMLGPLRIGNFGFIFKRPETGGTTFLASEVTFMATQTDRPLIWFNNEQPNDEVKVRLVQAYFGITTQTLFKNLAHYQKRYSQELEGRIKIYNEGLPTKKDVDRISAKYNPCLMVFDQIDKIKGFDDDRYDQELKQIYQWVRELAKVYGPTIGVCQAGGTAEGKKYLTMDDVDSSKTAKQGEADWILGIGKSHAEGMETVRHLHLCKNKLIGGLDTLPELRHGKRDVLIKAEIARYEDIP